MADRIAIDRDLIVSHAARVEQVASDIKVARDAASSTNMGGGAFGVLCSFLVAPATVAAAMAGNAISSAEGMVRRSATEVRGVATDMAAFEDAALAAIKALDANLS
ncbi:MAG: hypothetical protein J0I43_09620 [Microbacterium sp.]|uniref:hypothetical protein n=1 Tax=Microbacterium sp. TaxID=51671 RepID=UPI001AC61EFA|nr:hypothetical protein [Microbacterium sp.]MBN9177609.1 hypothetical protein [Microbacterium sp.]